MPSGTPLHSLPWLQKRSCFYNACSKWDNSGHYLGIHYICIMLCTVKVEQLGLQNIFSTNLFDYPTQYNFCKILKLNHFDYTQVFVMPSVYVWTADKSAWNYDLDMGIISVIYKLCSIIQSFSFVDVFAAHLWTLWKTSIDWIMNVLYGLMITCVFNFYRPWAYNSVRLVIWWKLYILLFEKRQSKGKKKKSSLLSIYLFQFFKLTCGRIQWNIDTICAVSAFVWFIDRVVIWQEHLIGFSDEEFEDRPKPVVVKDQTTISRLEEQAEEFLNAILCRKGQIPCICWNNTKNALFSRFVFKFLQLLHPMENAFSFLQYSIVAVTNLSFRPFQMYQISQTHTFQ